jgi:hypothetical protein
MSTPNPTTSAASDAARSETSSTFNQKSSQRPDAGKRWARLKRPRSIFDAQPNAVKVLWSSDEEEAPETERRIDQHQDRTGATKHSQGPLDTLDDPGTHVFSCTLPDPEAVTFLGFFRRTTLYMDILVNGRNIAVPVDFLHNVNDEADSPSIEAFKERATKAGRTTTNTQSKDDSSLSVAKRRKQSPGHSLDEISY